MKLEIKWDEGESFFETSPNEDIIFKKIGELLLNICVPNTIYINCENYGTAVFQVKKRGSFIKNGVTKPSMYVVEEYNDIHNLQQGIYKEVYLTCVNHESNNYKFYHLKPGISGINATYGRIGAKKGEIFGTKDLEHPYPTYMYWIRYYEKLSKGYIDQSDIYLDNIKPKNNISSKKTINEISSLSKDLYDTLKNCARQYVSSQCVSTNITFGQVKASIKLYKELCNRKTINGFNKKLMELVAVCPRKVRYVTELLAVDKNDFSSILQREENLISAMEALVSGAASGGFTENCFEALGINIFEATEKQKDEVFRHLDTSLHDKVDTIYRIIYKKHKERFNLYLKDNSITRVKQFWHGSKNENWFSIIVNGLQLNPDAAITGKMFGNGIYFAPNSEKSWKYTSYRGSYWARGDSDTAYMGLYATAYGIPENTYSSYKYTQEYLRKLNKNCVHAHAGKQLLNDEIVFYNESAMCLNYIVKFK